MEPFTEQQLLFMEWVANQAPGDPNNQYNIDDREFARIRNKKLVNNKI